MEKELFIISPERNNWLESSDEELLASCRFEPFKSTGRGGQKKNKTSSAVRLMHKASRISVTCSSSRSQRENRLKALAKLKMEIAMKARPEKSEDSLRNIRIEMSPSNREYFKWTAMIFDVLYFSGFSISDTSEKLGLSTSKLVKLLARNPTVWQNINETREKLGLKALRHPG